VPYFLNSDEGKGLLHDVLSYARDIVGFELSLAYGQRAVFLWGRFEGYRPLTRQKLQQHFVSTENNFLIHHDAQGAPQVNPAQGDDAPIFPNLQKMG
jgi:hypothetical protein